MAREEVASGRTFDPAFREKALQRLIALPAEALREAEAGTGGGLGLNALGDSQADLVYTPLTPCRIIDTRLAGGVLTVGTPRDFLVTGTDYSAQGGSATGCGVPNGPATAAVVNLVAVTASGPGHLRITPFGTAVPLAAIITYSTGQTVANGPAVALCDPAGATCTSDVTIQAFGSATHLVADVQGYFRNVAAGGVGTALLADEAVTGAKLATGSVTAGKIATGEVVKSLNAQTDAVTLGGMNGIGVTTGSGTLTVSSNATSANTADAIVARDGAGDFQAGTVGLAGNLDLPNTTSASVGVLTKNGVPFLHNLGMNNTFLGIGAGNLGLTGQNNTAVGAWALHAHTSGNLNCAFGEAALQSNTSGELNAAFGEGALQANTTATGNAAFGSAALFFNTTGEGNAAFGTSALQANTVGGNNSAFGYWALAANTTASGNSAFGANALAVNTTGWGNSAFGVNALAASATGYSNTAVGGYALQTNTTGHENAAVGQFSLFRNTTGYSNSAVGSNALRENTTGAGNVGVGGGALSANTTADDNVAVGYVALQANTTGGANSALGEYALASQTIGNNNSAFGQGALGNLTSGDGNTAVGQHSGWALTSGSHNIYLGNEGVATESSTIRIGDGNQTATYVTGISGATSASGAAVFVSSSGKLGTVTSSRRYKEGIEDMGGESDVLMRLRPVSFYYRPELDETHTRQYGLVAEEVAEQAPALVLRDESGAPQTVRYHSVNAMLLNEVQKQRRQLETQDAQLRGQEAELRELREAVARLEALLRR